MTWRIDALGAQVTGAALRGARQRILSQWATTAADFGGRMTEYAIRKFRSAPQTTDIATKRRTGALVRSMAYDVTPSATGLTLRVGYIAPGADAEALRYARTHEFGATIKPKRPGGYLTIPLPAVMTPRGVARGPARSFPDTYVLRARGGNGDVLLLMQKRYKGGSRVAVRGAGGRMVSTADQVPLFLLVKQVKVKARPALEPTRAKFQSEFIAALKDQSARAVFVRGVRA